MPPLTLIGLLICRIGALDLTKNLSGSADAICPEQVRDLRAGLHNSEELKRVAQQFLIDLANGVEGISCPNDSFEAPSVFDITLKADSVQT